jgi:hypothetical protein
MKNIFSIFINKKKVIRLSPEERDRVAFENHAKEQFKKLKEKGLSISIFNL